MEIRHKITRVTKTFTLIFFLPKTELNLSLGATFCENCRIGGGACRRSVTERLKGTGCSVGEENDNPRNGSLRRKIRNMGWRNEENVIPGIHRFVCGCRALTAGCGGGAKPAAETKPAADAKPINLIAYNPMPPSSVPTQALIKFAEIAEKNSNGRLKFTVKHSGQLGSDREGIESAKMGTIDVIISGTGMYSSFYDKVKIFDLPFLFTDAKQARKVVNGPIGERIFKDLDKQGFVYLATGDNGMRQVSSKKPIQTVADVKGLKIRLPEMPTYLAVWKSWGATPVPIPVSELYMSLKTGVVDAQDNAPYHTVATKCYEVQPNYSMINYMWMGLTAAMNAKKFNSLPPDLQKSRQGCRH